MAVWISNPAGMKTEHMALHVNAGFLFSFPSEYWKEIPVELSKDIKVWVYLMLNEKYGLGVM